MTIDRTKIKPNFYVEIDDVDCSNYLVGPGFFMPNSKEKISRGRFEVSSTFSTMPKRYKKVSFYVSYDNKYKKFGGVISDVVYDKDSFLYRIDVRSYAWLAYQTDFTGIFRSDSGKGNRKIIITDILKEKFPEVTWDEDSFPDVSTDYDILSKVYNNNKIGDIFDTLTADINRDWWIDENNKFFCKSRDYVEVNQPINNSNTNELPIIEINNNYANLVKVFGAKFEKTILNTYSGTGAADEFELDFFPAGSSDVEYSDGTRISTTMEGNENYDDSTEYDAYFKVSDKKLKFNANTTAGTDNILVKTRVYDQITETVPKASEINRIGYEIVKKISDDNISTQDEAYNIGLNYLENYGKEQYIYSVSVEISNDSQLLNWKLGNSVPLDVGDGSAYEPIIQEEWRWSGTSGLNLRLKFVDFPRTDNDVLKDLLNKVSRQENAIDNASTNVTKYIYMGNNIVIAIQNISIQTQAHDGRFETQSINQDKRSFMSRTEIITTGEYIGQEAAVMRKGDFITPIETELSENLNNEFIENFYDSWFVDEDNSTGTLDLENNTYTIEDGQQFQSTIVAKGIKNYKTVKLTLEGSGLENNNYQISLDGGTTWNSMSNGGEIDIQNISKDGIVFRTIPIEKETFPYTFPIILKDYGSTILTKIKIKYS